MRLENFEQLYGQNNWIFIFFVENTIFFNFIIFKEKRQRQGLAVKFPRE